MAQPSSSGSTLTARWELSSRQTSLVTFVLLFLITIPLLTKIFTSDFGTHIAIGREIVQTRHIQDKEFLNYPSIGRYNPNGEWGFQVVLYLVYAAAGEYGVSFLCWAIVFGVFLAIHRSTVLRGAHPLLAVVAIFAFSGFLRIRIQPRPEIFTYLFISLTILIFSEYYFGERKKLIYLFPPLILLWANMHPTYLMGFILCGAFVANEVVRDIWNRRFHWDRLKTWVIPPVAVGAAGLVLCGLNPHGYNAILAPLHLISRGGAAGGSGGGQMLMSISELTPVKGTGFYAYYKAAAMFAAVSLLLGAMGRRIYLLDLLLFTIAFKGAWDSARAVSMMGLFLSPGASLQLTGFLARAEEWFSSGKTEKSRGVPPKEKGKQKARKSGGEGPGTAEKGKSRQAGEARASWKFLSIFAATVASLMLFGGVTLAFSFGQLEYGIGMTQHKFSFQAAEFLRKNPIPGKMFNFFDIGGFLDWQLYPQALTFIDGRTYNQEVFMEHQAVTGAMPGWEEILRRHGVTYIVIKTIDSSGMILPILPVLANDPNWALVFSDGLFVVFVRNVPENQAYIRKFDMPKAILPRHIIAESFHYMHLGVSPIVAYQNISNMYQLMGDFPAAVRSLQQAVETTDDPFLRSRLMQLERRIGGAPTRGTR
ncbi:MAG: hypothetical protein C3F14_01555 [Deltaproteobacteria bacterium]|nr:MAG: hypothetical protein C3F14_01555 [Deltaproteobacteria bacterium]